MSLWRAIQDGDIDAESPVLAKIFSHLRLQQYGKVHVFSGCAEEPDWDESPIDFDTEGEIELPITATSFTVVGHIKVFVPAWVVGDNGTRIVISAKVYQEQNDSAPYTAYVKTKIGYGSTYSQEISTDAGGPTREEYELEIGGLTGDQIVVLDIYSESHGDNPGHFYWTERDAGNYMEAI